MSAPEQNAPEQLAGPSGPPAPAADPASAAADPAPASAADSRPGPGPLREALAISAAALAGTVLVGVGWRLLAPVAANASPAAEAQIARDAVLGLLGCLAGVVTALLLAWFPGPRPAARVAVTLVAVTAAGQASWAVGRLVGAPTLHAIGMTLLWPLTAAVVTTVRSLFALLFEPS